MAMVWMLVLLLQDAKQRYAEQINEMNDRFWKERIGLAEWAKSNGLYREAKGLLDFMVRRIPGRHPYKSKADNMLVGPWKNQANTATEKKQKEYAKRLEAYYRSVADKCFGAYKIAKSARMEAETKLCLDKTVEFYTDHEAARKERGEERVEGFGWVAKGSIATVLELGSRPVDEMEKEDGAHDTWPAAWVIRSKHYVLRTDLPARRAAAVLELLEGFYDIVKAWGEGTIPEPPAPMGICFFRRTEDLEKERARLPNTPAAVAFFHGLNNVVYVRSFDSAREKGDGIGASDREFLLHECTHQYFDMATEQRVFSVFQQANMRADSVDDYWVVEGIAGYFAARDSDSWRMARVKELLGAGRLPAVKAILAMNYDAFLADSFDNYAISYALALFLIETRKKPFLTFLKEYYLGNGTADSFRKIVGDPEKLEGEFRAWLDGR